MTRIPSITVCCAALSYGLSVCAIAVAEPIQPTDKQLEFFETNVRPVLVKRCHDCHSGEEPESGLNLESRTAMLRGGELGPAIVPGKPQQSLLIRAINHDEFIKMPPKEKLSTKELVDLTRWVETGAPWPNSSAASVAAPSHESKPDSPLFTDKQKSFWAFKPPVDPELPKVADVSWPISPIDYFVQAKREAVHLKAAPRADKRTLIRRATYDLTGLSPTRSEIEAFLHDESPDAFARVVDRLLASPRYGERWGRHWLDVARYADSNGLDENLSYANAFRYRDYVISAFNRDKPYDRFVQEQIAGDLLPRSGNECDELDRLVATGFLALGAKMLAEDDPVKMQMDIVDEQLSTLGQAFMGLTLGCARCHDHKFDPVPTADYYSLAGIFKSTKTMENHKVVAVWYERPVVTPEMSQRIAAIDKQIADCQRQLQLIGESTRKQAAEHIRRRFQHYLLAAAELAEFDQRAEQELAGRAQTKQQAAYAVNDGYALIEAEGFHRGNIERQNTNYGRGIGVILSFGPGGFAEYDLDVAHAGTYHVEVRYTAKESRSVGLIVNGEQAAMAICGEVTGSWFPDGQRWFAETNVHLKAGKNTLRFQSPRVYPHIDKFAVVLDADEWPFDSPRPSSLSQIAGKRVLHLQTAREFNAYLRNDDHHALRPWKALRDVPVEQFAAAAPPLLAEIQSAKGLGKTTPPAVKQALAASPPKSRSDVAQLYQTLIDRVDTEDDAGDPSLETLRREWADLQSPLSGPKKLESFYTTQSRELVDAINSHLKELRDIRPSGKAVAMGVTETKAENLRIHLRGSHITLGEVVPRRFPRIIAGKNQPIIGNTQSGRLQLARWLTDPQHPLTSRVIVNRIWHWHFGRGLVPSVDNFGQLGERPTHPELLDWLACRFVERGWSIKSLHRTIMLSSTYQMSTRFDPSAAAVDPENQWLWRMNRRRLSAEEARDSIIAVGAGLDLKIGGSLLKVKNRNYVTSTSTSITDEYDNFRRSVYQPVIRSALNDLLQSLDFPDPAVSNGRRETSTVAPQALLMMNSKLVADHTEQLARRLMQTEDAVSDRITGAYRTILGRDPSESDTRNAQEFLSQARTVLGGENEPANREVKLWQSLCRVLISSNEFIYVE